MLTVWTRGAAFVHSAGCLRRSRRRAALDCGWETEHRSISIPRRSPGHPHHVLPDAFLCGVEYERSNLIPVSLYRGSTPPLLSSPRSNYSPHSPPSSV